MAHKVKFFEYAADRHLAKCETCGWSSREQDGSEQVTKQVAEDKARKHHESVDRARAALRSRDPSLKSQADHYRKQEANLANSAADRKMWGILADELEARLGHVPTEEEEPALPFEVPTTRARSIR